MGLHILLRASLGASIPTGIPAFSPGRRPTWKFGRTKLSRCLEAQARGLDDPTLAFSPGRLVPTSWVRARLPRPLASDARRALCLRLSTAPHPASPLCSSSKCCGTNLAPPRRRRPFVSLCPAPLGGEPVRSFSSVVNSAATFASAHAAEAAPGTVPRVPYFQVAITVAVQEETGKEPMVTTDDSRGETGMSFSAAIAGLPPPMLLGLSSLQLLSPQAAEPEE
ncbi:uncharacterized protein LOC120689117 [Panicum virgatum]|uniref:uncharacterized protein LOC120689117 n=1 Tax=Panicum virgatum TaxID=38727 RepID=UPI0019D5ADE2|nr:uncharacterized protein LOC120689117 [Panicum virgatum]